MKYYCVKMTEMDAGGELVCFRRMKVAVTSFHSMGKSNWVLIMFDKFSLLNTTWAAKLPKTSASQRYLADIFLV